MKLLGLETGNPAPQRSIVPGSWARASLPPSPALCWLSPASPQLLCLGGVICASFWGWAPLVTWWGWTCSEWGCSWCRMLPGSPAKWFLLQVMAELTRGIKDSHASTAFGNHRFRRLTRASCCRNMLRFRMRFAKLPKRFFFFFLKSCLNLGNQSILSSSENVTVEDPARGWPSWTKKAKMLQKVENISFKGDGMAVVWYCVKMVSNILARKSCLFSVGCEAMRYRAWEHSVAREELSKK